MAACSRPWVCLMVNTMSRVNDDEVVSKATTHDEGKPSAAPSAHGAGIAAIAPTAIIGIEVTWSIR